MKITLNKALRMRTTIAKKLGTLSNRAIRFAVTYNNGPEPDFDPEKMLGQYIEEQKKLRKLKTLTASKSLSTLVHIPDNMPVAEAGSEVPVYQAVLIRDDMKSERELLDKMLAIPNTFSEYENSTTESGEKLWKIRNFNFDNALYRMDVLQDAIDELDGIIQGVDASVKFEFED